MFEGADWTIVAGAVIGTAVVFAVIANRVRIYFEREELVATEAARIDVEWREMCK